MRLIEKACFISKIFVFFNVQELYNFTFTQTFKIKVIIEKIFAILIFFSTSFC